MKQRRSSKSSSFWSGTPCSLTKILAYHHSIDEDLLDGFGGVVGVVFGLVGGRAGLVA